MERRVRTPARKEAATFAHLTPRETEFLKYACTGLPPLLLERDGVRHFHQDAQTVLLRQALNPCDFVGKKKFTLRQAQDDMKVTC